jgi:hypothetical protein
MHHSARLARLTGVKRLALILMLVVCAAAQTPSGDQTHGRSAGGDIGSGAGDIGMGAAKGAGNLAKGAGKGALNLVTLHPIDAAASVGKGAAAGGMNVAVGTVKGTGKIGKGIGKAIKKLF